MTRKNGQAPRHGDDFNSHARVGRDWVDIVPGDNFCHFNSHARVGRDLLHVERHAMSKKGPETKKAEKSRENIKKAQFYVGLHAKLGDKLQKGA